MEMSRAFVSENDTDAAADTLPELPQSPHPNYVTRRGLRLLEERLAEAQAEQHRLQAGPDDPATELRLAHVHRDIRYLEARIERAIPVDAAQQPVDEVAFGAVVEVRDSKGARQRFAIVGEDEADAERGTVSWVSPLARALIGSGVGDVVLWRRPAGEAELTIEAISYPERKR
jgi:transcription elongation factor GreB